MQRRRLLYRAISRPDLYSCAAKIVQFRGQVEALKKYRSAGEQTIKVQHVTVNEGGQAIVGNVSQGGGGSAKKWRPASRTLCSG